MGDGSYSFSLTTFSPSGKLVQIEYALAAVAGGKTSLGIKGRCDGGATLVLGRGALNDLSSEERRRDRDGEEAAVCAGRRFVGEEDPAADA